MSYHSLRVKGSTTRFLLPLPLESFLFLPTAMMNKYRQKGRCARLVSYAEVYST